MKLDKNIFGKNKAEINLSKILNDLDERKISRKVANILQEVTEMCKKIDNSNKSSNRTFYNLIRKSFYDRVDESNYDKLIETHLKNSITIRLRSYFLKTK